MIIETLKAKEKEHILKVLAKTSWDIEMSSHLLQISASQLRRKIKEHNLQRHEPVENG